MIEGSNEKKDEFRPSNSESITSKVKTAKTYCMHDTHNNKIWRQIAMADAKLEYGFGEKKYENETERENKTRNIRKDKWSI